MLVSCDTDFGRSWIILLNKIGTTIDSWGIPMCTFLADEYDYFSSRQNRLDIFIDISVFVLFCFLVIQESSMPHPIF